MTGGVFFIIIIPNESYEKCLQKKFYIGDKEECIRIDCDSANENLFDTKLDKSVNSTQKKSPLNKSRSMDLLCFDDISNLNKIIHKSWAGTGNKNSEDDNIDEFKFLSQLPLEKVLRIILKKQDIENAIWSCGQNENYIQVVFPLDSENCEPTLCILNEYGIGQRLNSVVSVIPCSLYYKESAFCEIKEEEQKLEMKKEQAKNSTWNKLVSSVRSRLTVAQVVESVRTNAELTFDFLVLLLIATIISAIALVENDNVFLVSSMLISPMMGPVMASTFGSVIQDRTLQKTGVKNELIGLGVATAVGFCYGSIVSIFFDNSGVPEWPSPEMVSRGEIRTLWFSCLIAILSGAAVALGILGANIASLVGVAISTSLMPPAVNAGLLWSMSAVYALFGESCKNLTKTKIYSDNDVYELAALGGMSMCLTFVNIVFIYLSGILVFKIKEVAPISSQDYSRRFWKHDIRVTRDYNKTIQNEDAEHLQKLLKEKLDLYRRHSLNSNNIRDIDDIVDHLYQSTEINTNNRIINIDRIQNTWSPSTLAPKRPTMKELKNLYFSSIEKPSVKRNLNFRFPFIRENTLPWTNSSHRLLSEDQGLPSIPETASSEESGSGNCPVQNTRKFVVTPVVVNILEGTKE